tara:strand:- start:969 stop:1310 length:342 start_codon:yes stop_codon:yes gene_type:complete
VDYKLILHKIINNKMIDKINNLINDFIESIPNDKKKHVIAGILLGYPLMFIGLILDLILGAQLFFILCGLIALALIGGKEIVIDLCQGKGNPEWWDFIASAIPIVAVIIAYLI